MTNQRIFNGGDYLVQDVGCREVFTPEDFTDEHRQIAATTEQFVASEIQPLNAAIEAGDFDLVVEKLKVCAELGLMMIDAPERYGGLELDKATSMVVMERMAFARNFGLSYMVQTGIGMLPLIYYGSADQKARYLGRLIRAELIGAYCLTEPGSGSDALGAKTTATLAEDGSCYILNGTKQFSSNAGFADLFTIFAKVDKVHFTAFLVERGAAGLSFGPEEKKMGMHGSSTRQVILDNVRVPVANRLGEEGEGLKIALSGLEGGRIGIASQSVGMARAAFEAALAYSKERQSFGQRIFEHQALQFKLADMATQIEAARQLIHHAASLKDAGKPCLKEAAMAKLFASEMAERVCSAAIQVFGGYGYVSDFPVERIYRDVRVCQIYEGTSEVQKILIGRALA
jgi:alkylation response protein AidB-like acyl-CoA dehydrogenase